MILRHQDIMSLPHYIEAVIYYVTASLSWDNKIYLCLKDKILWYYVTASLLHFEAIRYYVTVSHWGNTILCYCLSVLNHVTSSLSWDNNILCHCLIIFKQQDIKPLPHYLGEIRYYVTASSSWGNKILCHCLITLRLKILCHCLIILRWQEMAIFIFRQQDIMSLRHYLETTRYYVTAPLSCGKKILCRCTLP